MVNISAEGKCKMKKTDSASSPAVVLGFPVLVGFLATFLLLLIFAAAVYWGKAEQDLIVPMALTAIAVGCLAASFIAARRTDSNRFLWALAAGCCLLICLLLLSLVWVGQPISPVRIAINAADALISSCVGGLMGAGLRKKRKRRRTR